MRIILLVFVMCCVVTLSSTRATAYDVPQLCHDAATDAFARNLTIAGSIGLGWRQRLIDEHSTSDDILSFLRSYPLESEIKEAASPWVLNFPPQGAYREAALHVQMALAQNALRARGVSDNWRDLIVQTAQTPGLRYSDAALEDHFQIFDRVRRTPLYEDTLLRRGISSLCLLYPHTGCVAAGQELINVMQTRQFLVFLSLPDQFDALLSDPLYAVATSRLALKMEDRINQAHRGENPFSSSDDRLFEDTVASFASLGLNAAESRKYAFTLLGIYGARGAALHPARQLFHSGASPILVGMYYVFSAISYLDQVAEQYHTSYAMPSSIAANCTYGRPYHFWMSAFLTEHLLSKGFSRRASFMLPHLYSMTYEIFADVGGHGDRDKIFYGPFMNPYNLNVHINMVQNDLGSIWAAFGKDVPKALDINEVLAVMLRGARPLPNTLRSKLRGKAGELEKIQAFRQVIGSDFAADYLLKTWGDSLPFVESN